MKTEIPTHMQDLDENLSLREVIRAINVDRARLRAIRSAPSLQWKDIVGFDKETGAPLVRESC